MDKVRVNRATRRLRARGYIEQRTAADDRREALLELTPRGEEVCRDLMRVVLDLQTTLLGRVGSEEYAVFERVLGRFESQAKTAESSARDPIARPPTLCAYMRRAVAEAR